MDIYTERIKPLFLSTGKTMRELAPLIGIPEKAIYNWENGVKSYNKYYTQIAKYFNVSIEYLRGETDDPMPTTPDESPLLVSEKDKRLLTWFRSLPPEKQQAILISQDAPEGLV